MKKILIMMGACSLVLAGCETPPTEKDRFNLAVAQQVCNVDGLAEEKKTSQRIVNDSKYSIAKYQNKSGTYTENTYTILDEKLNRYSAELESSYRFVVQNCSIYTRCMETNHHDEFRCQGSEARWAEAQGRFNDLTLNIRRIAADLEKTRIETEADADGHYSDGWYDGYDTGYDDGKWRRRPHTAPYPYPDDCGFVGCGPIFIPDCGPAPCRGKHTKRKKKKHDPCDVVGQIFTEKCARK